MVGPASVRRVYWQAVRMRWLMAVLLLLKLVVLPWLIKVIMIHSEVESISDWRGLLSGYLSLLTLLSFLCPLDVMRLYAETRGNEILLRYNRFPNVEAYVFVLLSMIVSGLSVIQIGAYLEYRSQVFAVLLCIIAIDSTLVIALYSISSSYVPSLLAGLLLAFGLTFFRNPIMNVSGLPDLSEVRRIIIKSCGTVALLVLFDFAAARQIRYR